MIDEKTIKSAYIDTPHNPEGKGWKHNVHGRFMKKPEPLNVDSAALGCMTVLWLIAVCIIWYLVTSIGTVQYPNL